ncbi:FimV/HubP family polar landmark protein [Chromobacterium sp. IIBBL 290-4]|uniref:FimV/HubP family polar landmark protein n=1 Tax=Chromobacterium sp. IIBBL 290-4 TaxID=2953890 RepID=UPI0020B87285|nr:FimV/HubP family polar landmark protein [Chromobacterium sp. IIBBL 290-4]UTH73816.1 hypothetical protein NKT35_20075 [Chromobacterium sp. IIBBL 290-4]
MGKIYVRSNLGEFLKADIEMTGVPAGEMDAVRVGLAGIETFQNLNVEYSAILSSLRFALSPNAKGALIRVSSVQPINDPYLRFVVEAKAPSGRSVREYTVLLDPANYGPNGQRIVQDVPSYADDNQTGRYQASASTAKAAPATPATLTVKAGATLRALAMRVKPKGATLRQTMAALVQANPDAFSGDLNHPQAGSVLKVPSARKTRALSAQQVAGILGEPAPAQQPADGAQPGKGGDVLKLPPGDGDNARLNDLQKQINDREKALQDATSRISALEQQLKAMQQSGMAPRPAAMPASAPMPEVKMAASAPAPAASAPIPAPKPKVEPPRAAPKPAHVVPPLQPPRQSMLDKLMDNLPLVGGGTAAVGLLGLLGFMIARRRKSSAASDLASATLSRSTVTGHGPNTVGGSHSFMSNFTQAAGAIDAGEVDPVAEAEVYIAYGRDQQAEEILKDALQKDPSRHEVRMKLLEIYATRADVGNFERLAKEMHAAFDGQGVLWAKTASLGRGIDPENPLYQVSEEELQPVEARSIDLDRELFGSDAEMLLSGEAAEPPPAAEMPQEEDPLAALFDTPVGETGGASAEPPALDFDLESALQNAIEAAPAPAPAAEAAETNLLDFDFNLDEPAAEAKPAEAAEAGGLESLYEDMASVDNPPADDAGLQSAPPGSMDDPLSTKLDLAKVYLDMGDREGASEVLQDLLGEAQGALKQEAQALLDKIGV